MLATFAIPAAAVPPVGPAPATSHPVTLSASPTDGLVAGQTVTLTVSTSGGTTLVGNLAVHVCEHGLSNYSLTNFGYSGAPASRCVYEEGIVAGGLTGSDYEKTFGPYSGSQTTTGPLTFHVGTGSVTWGNDSGFGPFTLDADSSNPVDLVVQVNLAGDTTNTTYFVQPITFAGAPDAPTDLAATVGNGSASIALTPPANNGGATVSQYDVSCVSSDGGDPGTGSGAASPVVVTGLTNGDTYTCTATATNGAATSAVSDPSPAFVPEAVPNPPTAVTVTAGNASASVSFTAPDDPGAGDITGYTVSCASTNGGAPSSASGAAGPIAITGLTNAKTYTCTATATNAVGTSLDSAPSNSFIPATTPIAPTGQTATTGNGQATVHWAAPANQATSAITGYSVTGYIGYYPSTTQVFNSPATTAVLTGLVNGQKYVFKITAKNAAGLGAASTATSPIVIGAPASPATVHATAGPRQAKVQWAASVANGAPVNSYTVTVYVAGVAKFAVTYFSTALTQTIGNLTRGKQYTFKVGGVNSRGTGVQSAVSNVVVPT